MVLGFHSLPPHHSIVIFSQITYFLRNNIFHFSSSKSFQTGCHCFHTHSTFLPFQFYLLLTGHLFLLIRFFSSLMYIKPLWFLSINSSVLILFLIGKVIPSSFTIPTYFIRRFSQLSRLQNISFDKFYSL